MFCFMKKIAATLCFIIISTTSFASHLLGGEITWRCLPNGQYIFSMTVYRDCWGIDWTFSSETIDIQGSPLPSSSPAGGAIISSIVMNPDVNRLAASNNGDITPSCSPSGVISYSCDNRDPGTVQAFHYNSNPINLYGTPPSSGWQFFWQAPCCRANDIDNVNSSGSTLLRAAMYPTSGQTSADPCFDSSPIFKAPPAIMLCRGADFAYNHTAVDNDLDSLVYSWDRPYYPPSYNPQALTYKAGFSPNSPTPNRNVDSRNIPATLDPVTGIIKFTIFSGTTIEKYLTVVKVDAYRSGKRIASIYRELPITLFNCPNLPSSGSLSLPNTPPQVTLNGSPGVNAVVEVVAGQTVKVPIQLVDHDVTNTTPFRQQLTMTPEGSLFTRSKNGPAKQSAYDPNGEPCNTLNGDLNPCGYLQNANPFVDVTANPPTTVLKGLGSLNTEFVWQTDCNHILRESGIPGTNESIHNFVLRVQDDFCPIPGITYPTITVKVKDPTPLEAPVVKGVSVNLDGSTTYSWVPPIDSATQFKTTFPDDDHYEVYSSRTNSGQGPTFFTALNRNLKKYKQEFNASDLSPYALNNPFDPNSGYNVFQMDGTNQGLSIDHYLRMRTLSGCTDTNTSRWSQTARIIELNAKPAGVSPNPIKSRAELTWNRAKPVSSISKPYWKYESATHFYIYVNDSISNGGVSDSSNWYLVGDTSALVYYAAAGNCLGYTAFRVEARDTVITYKQGNGIHAGSDLDTLYFSTFSTLDTLFMIGSAPRVLDIKNVRLQSSIERKSYQWVDCNTNQPLVADTFKTFIPTAAGSYKVVTANKGCSGTSSCFQTVALSDSVFLYNNDSLQAKTAGVLYQWYNCSTNLPITGATSQTFKPQDTGYYKVVVKAYGYSDTSSCVPVLAIGLNENKFHEEVSYFPNPNNGQITINLERVAHKVEVQVRNIQGQLVQTDLLLNDKTFKIELNQPSGIYFIQLTNEKGERANLKLVKQ